MQDIWFSEVNESLNSFDTVSNYGTLIHKKMTVSSGTGQPGQISAGLVVDYDREIINFEHDFIQSEGNAVWIDVKPQIDEDGNLIMAEDGITPITPPDYRIKQIFRTQKGLIDVFGVKKIGGN